MKINESHSPYISPLFHFPPHCPSPPPPPPTLPSLSLSHTDFNHSMALWSTGAVRMQPHGSHCKTENKAQVLTHSFASQVAQSRETKARLCHQTALTCRACSRWSWPPAGWRSAGWCWRRSWTWTPCTHAEVEQSSSTTSTGRHGWTVRKLDTSE